MEKIFDPKKEVAITKADKRGDHVTIEGVVEGRKVSVEIPQPSLDRFKSMKEQEAYIRRGLLGTKRQEDRGER